MNLGDIRTRVKRQFGDESGAQINDDDIARWANDAQADIVRRTEVLQGESTFNVVAGTDNYALPADFMYARRVTYDGRLVARTSIEELDKLFGDREESTTTGTPDKYYIWDDKIYVFPIPDTTLSAGLKIQYVQEPATLVNASDTPALPSYQHEDIVRYCVGRAKELNEDFDQAGIIMNDYETRIGKAREESFWPYTDSYPAVRAIPGDDY